MVLKKYFDMSKPAFLLVIALLCLPITGVSVENNALEARSITLSSTSEFQLLNQQHATLTIRPLKEKLRSIENLKNTEAVGITYLGKLTISDNATPLTVLRELSVQISNGLGIDLALITDSTTSESLKPHEMLLLYHPRLVITLALTKIEGSLEYTLIGTYAIPVSGDSMSATLASNSEEQM